MPEHATSFELDPAIQERVQRLALAQQRTPDSMLRDALLQYIEREERRDLFLRESQVRWEAYQLSGLHLSGDEADAWLAQLEAGEDAPPPPCHV